jgi:hypothetical protein
LIDEDVARSALKYHKPKHLSEAVQKFWNGPSCEVVLEDTQNIDEVIDILKKAKANQG